MSIGYAREIDNYYCEYFDSLIIRKRTPKYYRKYLDHILEHKKMVYTAWIYIQDTLCELGFISDDDVYPIFELVACHDESKLETDEFIPYAKRFNGPKPKDLTVKENFKAAVMLHKMRNPHHYESLKKRRGENWKHYAVELICDYIAMGWEFNNYICEYFEVVKEELKNALPEEYYNFIENVISIIPERLSLAEEPLTENNIGYIYHLYDYHNDPFEEEEPQAEKKLV